MIVDIAGVLPVLVALTGAAAVTSGPVAFASILAMSAAGVATAAVAYAWIARAPMVAVWWIPSWNVRATAGLDGWGALFALIAGAVGLAAIVYAHAYVPRYLEHHEMPADEVRRFHASMLLFMAAMLALAVAQDLLTLFIAWELTSVVSYALIGFHRGDRDSGRAALMALVVTAGSAVPFLVGVVMLAAEAGTYDLGAIRDLPSSPRVAAAAALVAVGALAKSAQAPLHFWLPRAMVAPTPVSAYLHSAALVAAGVFLLGRFAPLWLETGLGSPLVAIGFVSMAVGGAFALVEDKLKRVLAYSTMAQR